MYSVCKTDTGKRRSMNQDTCRCGMFSDHSAWTVVCDGMGGVRGGNIASELAADAIAETFTNEFNDDMSGPDIKNMMIGAVNVANERVLQRAAEEPQLRGMGTTVVAAIASKGVLHVVHVGDSRCYLKNSYGVKQITVDHSFVQQLVDNGVITQEEARVHPKRNLITRVVGVHEDVECDYGCFNLESGDLVVSCSDGLSNYFERDTLPFFIENYEGEKLAEKLIDFANNAGGSDNITVALIDNR